MSFQTKEDILKNADDQTTLNTFDFNCMTI